MNNQNNQNDLNNLIANYQAQKNNAEAELQTISNNLAVARNNLANLEQQAQQLFGTTDITKLSTMMEDLVVAQQALESELNSLNMEG